MIFGVQTQKMTIRSKNRKFQKRPKMPKIGQKHVIGQKIIFFFKKSKIFLDKIFIKVKIGKNRFFQKSFLGPKTLPKRVFMDEIVVFGHN